MDPDLELLERWRGGDSQAGQDLFARHFAEVYRFLQYKCCGDADEVVQQTFLACVKARDQFRGQSSFRTYLFTIARNELYRHLRRLQKNERLDFSITSIGEIATTPGSRLGRAQELEHLREALGELPAEQQLLLEMHYWHELEAPALAEVFEVNAVTIRTRLFRARQSLRERMQARIGPTSGQDGVGGGEGGRPAPADRLLRSLLLPDEGEDEGAGGGT